MEGSIDETIPHMQMVFDARNLRVLDPGLSAKDRQAVQTRMLGPEVLDVGRFQWISYHSITIQQLDAGGWQVNGELELHGKIRPVPVKVVRENGRYKGSVRIRQSDFGIAPISIIGGTVKVKDEIVVEFDIVP
jgi:polyisoprenoid-binding protein YceI